MIADLSKNAETKSYIDQIQALKTPCRPRPRRAPLPKGCTVTS